MKVGFIGLGNMAKAMIGGILKKDIVSCEDIIGSAATKKTCEKVSEKFGIQTRDSNRKVAQEADVIILAVKPQYLKVVIADIMDSVDENKVIVSIAAGKDISWIEKEFENAEVYKDIFIRYFYKMFLQDITGINLKEAMAS